MYDANIYIFFIVSKKCRKCINKKKYLELLLLADEQESMVDRYLERGDMFVLFSSKMAAIGVAVVTDEGNGVCELKNLAVHPDF